jgi:hypothetical protein
MWKDLPRTNTWPLSLRRRKKKFYDIPTDGICQRRRLHQEEELGKGSFSYSIWQVFFALLCNDSILIVIYYECSKSLVEVILSTGICSTNFWLNRNLINAAMSRSL